MRSTVTRAGQRAASRHIPPEKGEQLQQHSRVAASRVSRSVGQKASHILASKRSGLVAIV